MIVRPRQNRVTPAGTIEATPHKGTLMGNRGDLHSIDGTLGSRRWRGKRWIACKIDHGKWPRVSLDVPGRYYPLFFHDEAVALAAGHRPCAACRRSAFDRFITAFASAHGDVTVSQADEMLHADRLDMGRQRHHHAPLTSLPNGVYVSLAAHRDTPMLWWDAQLYPWSHAGYGLPSVQLGAKLVTVLTPSLIVAALAAGYEPETPKAIDNVAVG